MVAVSQPADRKCPDSSKSCKWFIHQAGTYQRDPELKTKPFYSPSVAKYCSSQRRECGFVAWGQHAHVPTPWESAVFYYTRYRDCGGGVLEVLVPPTIIDFPHLPPPSPPTARFVSIHPGHFGTAQRGQQPEQDRLQQRAVGRSTLQHTQIHSADAQGWCSAHFASGEGRSLDATGQRLGHRRLVQPQRLWRVRAGVFLFLKSNFVNACVAVRPHRHVE